MESKKEVKLKTCHRAKGKIQKEVILKNGDGAKSTKGKMIPRDYAEEGEGSKPNRSLSLPGKVCEVRAMSETIWRLTSATGSQDMRNLKMFTT